MDKSRNYHLDNAKFLLVSLVLIVHFLYPHGGQFSNIITSKKNVFIFLMLFIMPAFTFVSGYFAKDSLTSEDIKKSIITLIIPYLIFETIFYFASNKQTDFILEPLFYLWYLPCLFAWRFMLTIFVNFRFPILIAILISIAVGYSLNVSYFLTLSRLFYFFPFFLAGYYSRNFDFNSNLWQKLAAIFSLIVIFIVICIISPWQQKWVLGSYPYELLGHGDWTGGAIRLTLYVTTFIMIFSFIALVPKNYSIMSIWGTRTLYPYLLHGFVARPLFLIGIYDSESFIKDILLVLAGLLTTIILSSRISMKLFKWVIQPEYLNKVIFSKVKDTRI